jgi:hypothetical protein
MPGTVETFCGAEASALGFEAQPKLPSSKRNDAIEA